ncbi:F-box protein At4g18380 [Lactuca sativa]|uniref:F-box protein At4g18380 n=1 Tax=Lactuca sativa TaxID=4236 RepID=UPI000CB2C49C|nr:F-box protein At4g18380 [Lactuca sativa]XP_023735602.1 F-box protein At4g18380 [Lactuca sativa]XP_023735603.1 F-box protein At4g18380 [Lactuca sativa]XP_023735605.1 F-box protein At4g18380 [Lactuca sativa]XP_023735606.1 F-box protein At4g18380 [Lactuca sativa]
MKNIVKSPEEDADASSPFSRLPDEIILQIVNKLIDLKALCFCYLVSKRFSSIVLQVDAISFTSSMIDANIPDTNTISDVARSRPRPTEVSSFFGEAFLSAKGFLNKFKGVKSLYIELPSVGHRAIDNRCLFKWKVKFGKKSVSFIFLSPNSICDKDGFYLNGNGDEEEDVDLTSDLIKKKFAISIWCMEDVMAWYIMFLHLLDNLPMLEGVSITDSGRRGRFSLNGEKLSEVKQWWLHPPLEPRKELLGIPNMVSKCYIPVLNLPVSGYMMKGIFCALMESKNLDGEIDGLLNSEDGFDDKEEAAYIEAMKEVLEKHRGLMD